MSRTGRLRAATSAALAVVALAVAAGPAPAASALNDERYSALDGLYTALLAFDRTTVSTAAIDRAQRACERLDRGDALLGPVRRACSATIVFARRAEIFSECSTPDGCLQAAMAMRTTIGRVLDTSRVANRAIETVVRSPSCRRALRAPASELRPLEQLISALRLLENAIRTNSQPGLEEANRRIAAFDRATRSGPSAREYRTRFRRACR